MTGKIELGSVWASGDSDTVLVVVSTSNNGYVEYVAFDEETFSRDCDLDTLPRQFFSLSPLMFLQRFSLIRSREQDLAHHGHEGGEGRLPQRGDVWFWCGDEDFPLYVIARRGDLCFCIDIQPGFEADHAAGLSVKDVEIRRASCMRAEDTRLKSPSPEMLARAGLARDWFDDVRANQGLSFVDYSTAYAKEAFAASSGCVDRIDS